MTPCRPGNTAPHGYITNGTPDGTSRCWACGKPARLTAKEMTAIGGSHSVTRVDGVVVIWKDGEA